jgi:hypothetical protein
MTLHPTLDLASPLPGVSRGRLERRAGDSFWTRRSWRPVKRMYFPWVCATPQERNMAMVNKKKSKKRKKRARAKKRVGRGEM